LTIEKQPLTGKGVRGVFSVFSSPFDISHTTTLFSKRLYFFDQIGSIMPMVEHDLPSLALVTGKQRPPALKFELCVRSDIIAENEEG
jgi:hypothetical protein